MHEKLKLSVQFTIKVQHFYKCIVRTLADYCVLERYSYVANEYTVEVQLNWLSAGP